MTATLTCAHCGGALGSGDRFCGQCGAELLSCTSCGESLLPSDISCPACGTPAEPTVLQDALSFQPTDSQSPWTDMVERLRRATLGEFEIGRELGRGGMAAVFLAHEISLDRKVAIKVMAPGLLLSDGMIDRFRHEAITIAHLHHPNIVSVHSVRQAEGLYFFVMRYVQGRSLEQVIQQTGSLPLPIVRSILYQVGSALTYAHRSRVIHRDIKPANILIDGDGNAVVTDFGIAKVAETPSQTLTGALVGTPAYMSPEQCSGAEVSGASDQYALGAVAYEMVTGVPPFSGSTLTVMQAHVERPPFPIRECYPDCPPELEAAILRMLAKDPAARWPRMADAMTALGATPLGEDNPMRLELSRLVAAVGDTSLSGQPTPTSPAPWTRRSSARGETAGTAVGGISILPPPADLEVGDSFVLVAMVRGQHGTRLPPNAVRWSSDPPDVLHFGSGGGVAVAVAAGSTLLTASRGEVRAVLRVEVTSPRADEITIGPLDHGVAVGDEIRLDAIARDKRGQLIARPVSWESDDSSTASVTADGTVVARAPGFTRITAALENARASIVIPVLPARVTAIHVADSSRTVESGRTIAVDATPVDRWGSPLAGRTLLWSSSDVRVAVVTAGGWVHALRPGSVVLTATCEGVSESVRVDVREPIAAPPKASLGNTGPGDTAASEPRPSGRRRLRRHRRSRILTATLAAGVIGALLWLLGRSREPTVSAALPETASSVERTVTTESTPPAPVVNSPRPGPARVAAEGRKRRDSAMTRVLRPASISIAPRDPLRVGDTATVLAVVLDRKGDTLAGAEVAWRSSNLSVAAIDPRTGQVRARSPGTALIIAQSGSESALSEMTVLPPAVAEVLVQGARPLVVGETLTLRAVPRNRLGDELSDRRVVWASSDSSVVSVDSAAGVVAARAAGSAEITATSEGTPGRVSVTVSPKRETAPTGEAAAEPQRIEAGILAGADQCYGALQSKDVGRLAEMYQPATRSDLDKLKKLSRILRTQEWSAVVGQRVDGKREIGPRAAAMEFSFHLTWKDAFGGRLSSQPVFRAEFARSGNRWEMSSCRIVGSPKL